MQRMFFMNRHFQGFAFSLVILASVPALSQTPYSWLQKVSGSGHGSSLCSNPINPNIIYGSPNTNVVWISRDRGNTWVQLGSSVGGSGGIAAMAVNPLDTNQIIVAQRSSPNRVMKTTNNGQTWTQTWAGGSFNSFGVPIEHKVQHPLLVIVMGSSQFYRSNDFGSTWTLVSTPSFNAWCDAEISPVDDKTIVLGTVSSGIWKSTNSGVTWTLKHNNSSGEVPMVGWSSSNPNILYATRWGGLNGVVKSTDYGETWVQVPQVTGSMWSIAVAPDNPNYVVSCNYGTSMYITRNGGQSWVLTNAGLSGSGNGALVVDTFKVFALNAGIFKLNVPENVSARNVRMVFSVDVNHGIDYHNDTPLINPLGVWIKGELPALGSLGGSWTFADTSNGTFVRLYDNGTNGDITPGDNIWTRSILIPPGTALGPFRYKYGAAYPGVDTVNGGVQYLNNESAPADFHNATFSDVDTLVVLPADRWKTRGTVFPSIATMSVDLRGGSDYYSGVPISSITQSVWVKGSLPVLGRMSGDWTFADTANGYLIRLFDDGTNGDPAAGDRIWTRAVTFPENSRVGPVSYKYAAIYPGIQNNNGGVAYLNNESAPTFFHAAVLAESTLTLQLSDQWLTRAAPVFQVSPESLALGIQLGDSSARTLTISNAAEVGSNPLSYSIQVEDSAFDRVTTFGNFVLTFTGASRDRGNIYYVSRNSVLKEIRSYLGISASTNLYFFVYECGTRTGTYTRIFQTNGFTGVGTKWYNSGPVQVNLRAGKYYYIGSSWLGSVTYGRDSTYSGPIPTEFGELLTGQTVTAASYPPIASINGSAFSGSYGPYFQSIKVNTTAYINLSQDQGQVQPEASDAVLLRFNSTGLQVGDYFPVFTIRSNDPNDSLRLVPCHLTVSPVTSVNAGNTPAEFALSQNYPNPFNPSTVIQYQLPVSGIVIIRVFNILGQEVLEVENTPRGPGNFQAIWNGTNSTGNSVSSGLYFYQLSVTDPGGSPLYRQRRKMLLVR